VTDVYVGVNWATGIDTECHAGTSKIAASQKEALCSPSVLFSRRITQGQRVGKMADR
jgi:hypothetical protein